MFKKSHTYELVDSKGFIDANIANYNLAQEILSTGGLITVRTVEQGNAMGVTYADNTYNEFACIWASEVRFFKEVPPAAAAVLAKPKGPYLVDSVAKPLDDYPTKDIKHKKANPYPVGSPLWKLFNDVQGNAYLDSLLQQANVARHDESFGVNMAIHMAA